MRIFNSEIEAIKNNKKIENKLMIISLYMELFNYITANVEEFFSLQYTTFMQTTLKSVAESISMEEDKPISTEQFMKEFLALLKMNKLSNEPKIKSVIDTFEANLSNLEESMSYVDFISKTYFSLKEQADIMLEFRTYLNDIASMFKYLFAEDNKEFFADIIAMLEKNLKDYLYNSVFLGLKEETIIKDLKPFLMRCTKDYLIEKLKSGELIKTIKDPETLEFMLSLNKIHRNIMLMGQVYALSGYDDKDKIQR